MHDLKRLMVFIDSNATDSQPTHYYLGLPTMPHLQVVGVPERRDCDSIATVLDGPERGMVDAGISDASGGTLR